MRKTYRQAFTLVELLVVISLLVALSALLFPVFVRVRESGQQSRTLAHMRQIGGSTHLYASVNDDRFPNGLGANCYSLVHKFGKRCSGVDDEVAKVRPSFWSQIKGFVPDKEILRFDLDRIQRWLAADDTHQESWWKETDFSGHYGMSFEYALGALGQTSDSEKDGFPMLYSLFELGAHETPGQGSRLLLQKDLSVNRVSSREFGRVIME